MPAVLLPVKSEWSTTRQPSDAALDSDAARALTAHPCAPVKTKPSQSAKPGLDGPVTRTFTLSAIDEGLPISPERIVRLAIQSRCERSVSVPAKPP